MATTDELLDNLMKDYKKPEDLIGENGLLKHLTKRLLERAMQAELTEHLLTEHLGYEKHVTTGMNSGNSRNGGYKKTVTGDFSNIEVTTPLTAIQHLNRLSCLKVNPAYPTVFISARDTQSYLHVQRH
jgi:putative transposase